MEECRKGRKTTLVSEYVSRSRSSHFSGSHRVRHYVIEREDKGGEGEMSRQEREAKKKGGQLVKHRAHSKHVCPYA